MKNEMLMENNTAVKRKQANPAEAIKMMLLIISVCYHLTFLPGVIPQNGFTYLINFICTVITLYNIITRI